MLSLLLALASTAGPYDVTNYGASPNLEDNRPAIQAAVDAAGAVSAADQNGGGVVSIPQASRPYKHAGPIYLDRAGVTVRGEGRKASRLAPYGGGYIGPAFALVTRLEKQGLAPARYRPTASALDATGALAWGRPRLALATRGEVALVVTGHPLQLGSQPPPYGGTPVDYWSGPGYTVEFLVEQPAGVTWLPGSGLFGCMDEVGPAPLYVLAGGSPGAFQIRLRTSDQPDGDYHQGEAQGAAKGPWRVCFLVDPKGGRVRSFINGAAAKVALDVKRLGPPGGPQPPFRPGLQLKRHDGMTPWVLGSTYGVSPNGSPVTDSVWHGLRVSSGLVYDMDAPAEVNVANPGRAVCDLSRYFELLQTPNHTTFAALSGADAPATHVRLDSNNGWGVGFLVPTRRDAVVKEVGVVGVGVASGLQPAVVIGEALDPVFEGDEFAGALQGVGTLCLGASYTVRLRGCWLGGGDAAYVGYSQIVEATEVTFKQVGRDAVRTCGVSGSWSGVYVMAGSPIQETVYRAMSGDYGQSNRLVNWFDDEESKPPGRCFVEVEQGAYCPNGLHVSGFNVGVMGGKPFVRLVGFGDKGGGVYWPGDVKVEGLTTFNRDWLDGAAVQVDGKGWSGLFSPSGLDGGKVGGDGAAAVRVSGK